MSALRAIEPSPLEQHTTTANVEHGLTLRAGQEMIKHAIRAGEALLAAREACAPNEWLRWVDSRFDASRATASNYMRVALHKEHILEIKPSSMRIALNELAGKPGLSTNRRLPALDNEAVAEANALLDDGASLREVARQLGMGRDTVQRAVDPEYAEKRRAYLRDYQAARDRERREEREQAEQRRLKRLARAAKGGIAEAYSLAERMQDVLAAAEREATDPEAKAALIEAGGYYRRMRDEIVRALGAS